VVLQQVHPPLRSSPLRGAQSGCSPLSFAAWRRPRASAVGPAPPASGIGSARPPTAPSLGPLACRGDADMVLHLMALVRDTTTLLDRLGCAPLLAEMVDVAPSLFVILLQVAVVLLVVPRPDGRSSQPMRVAAVSPYLRTLTSGDLTSALVRPRTQAPRLRPRPSVAPSSLTSFVTARSATDYPTSLGSRTPPRLGTVLRGTMGDRKSTLSWWKRATSRLGDPSAGICGAPRRTCSSSRSIACRPTRCLRRAHGPFGMDGTPFSSQRSVGKGADGARELPSLHGLMPRSACPELALRLWCPPGSSPPAWSLLATGPRSLSVPT
jgi:hypothetical protein